MMAHACVAIMTEVLKLIPGTVAWQKAMTNANTASNKYVPVAQRKHIDMDRFKALMNRSKK